jgi:hypothetical protein
MTVVLAVVLAGVALVVGATLEPIEQLTRKTP